MNFEDAYVQMHEEIRKLSFTQRIPDMDREDVESEMLICLWKAAEAHDPNQAPIGGLWWRVWSNRRKDLLAAYYRAKRVHGIPFEFVPETGCTDPTGVPLPFPMTPTQYGVWTGLSRGDRAREVQEDLGLTRRAYERTIQSFRTQQVREVLS